MGLVRQMRETERFEGEIDLGYEVDVIGVGKESKSGDAIALRWGNLRGGRNEQKVVIIDGGFQESGQEVVDHIKFVLRNDIGRCRGIYPSGSRSCKWLGCRFLYWQRRFSL